VSADFVDVVVRGLVVRFLGGEEMREEEGMSLGGGGPGVEEDDDDEEEEEEKEGGPGSLEAGGFFDGKVEEDDFRAVEYVEAGRGSGIGPGIDAGSPSVRSGRRDEGC
jgi:hypothetical protein